MKAYPYFTCLLLFLCACQDSAENNTFTKSILKEIDTPCKEGGEPNLFVSDSGQIYLSWIEYLNDTTDALLFSKLEKNGWSVPQTIASGSDWFVNWADFPSMVAYKDGGKSLAAHWLQKSASGSYDYDVHIAQSFDSGKTWNSSFIPHLDSISAEHGFVSFLPLSADRVFATWLDGRNTKVEGHGETSHGDHGAMSLRSAVFDKLGDLYDETELDDRVCDCCQTSAALTEEGVIVAYRDRSEDEIRDIAIVRQVGGKWTKPLSVFEDNWYIAGCPVNGPSIKAVGKTVVIVWFSMPDGKPQVKVAFSQDSGATFSQPIRVDDSNPLGRVDVVLLSEKEALVSWLEKTEDAAIIKAVKLNPKGKTSDSFSIASSDASRKSGFPVMVKEGNQIVFAWTNTKGLTTVKSAMMKVE